MNKIIFYLLLFILMYKSYNFIENFINNQAKWNNYRFGDIFYRWKNLEIPDKNGLSYLDKVSINYPNSIADKYLKLVTNEKQKVANLKILNKIVKSTNYSKPHSEDIILHLRLGDVIYMDKNNNLSFKKLSKKNKTYAIQIHKLDKFLNIIKHKTKNRKIILLYGAHLPNNKKANLMYLDRIKKTIRKNNFIFEENNSGDPDKDLVFMANSKIFIKSNGNFSNIISNLVKLNNGIVIDLDNK